MRYKTSKYSAYLERGRLSFQIRELCESYCVDFSKIINYTSIYRTIQVSLWKFVNSRIRETLALCPVCTAEASLDSTSIADSGCLIYRQTWAVGRLFLVIDSLDAQPIAFCFRLIMAFQACQIMVFGHWNEEIAH